MPNRYYSSVSVTTALTGTISPTATSITVAATTGFPSSYPYTLILDPDTVSEEIVSVTGAAGTTLTVSRGQDGSVGVDHTAGAVVNHGVSARDFREPQAHMDLTSDVHGVVGSLASANSVSSLSASTTSGLATKIGVSTVTAKGDLLVASAAGTVTNLAAGTDGKFLTTDSTTGTGLKWSMPVGFPIGVTAWNNGGTQQEVACVGDFLYHDIDATNLKVSFVAPASGKVLVELSGVVEFNPSTIGGYVFWNLRDTSGDVSGATGTAVYSSSTSSTQGMLYTRPTVGIAVSGLTPGTTYTYKWGQRAGASGFTGKFLCGAEHGYATMKAIAL